MFYIKFHIYELLFKAIIVTFDQELLVMILKMLIYKIKKICYQKYNFTSLRWYVKQIFSSNANWNYL